MGGSGSPRAGLWVLAGRTSHLKQRLKGAQTHRVALSEFSLNNGVLRTLSGRCVVRIQRGKALDAPGSTNAQYAVVTLFTSRGNSCI